MQISMFILMSSFMAFLCIRLALLSEVGFPCLCGSECAYVFVCVWETESEQEEGEGEKEWKLTNLVNSLSSHIISWQLLCPVEEKKGKNSFLFPSSDIQGLEAVFRKKQWQSTLDAFFWRGEFLRALYSFHLFLMIYKKVMEQFLLFLEKIFLCD